MKLSAKQIAKIKEKIDYILEERCIDVVTTLKLDEKDGFTLSSTKFTTVPKLHDNLSIGDFGGSVREYEDNEDKFEFWIRVHANYDGNGVQLFEVVGWTYKNDEREVYFK